MGRRSERSIVRDNMIQYHRQDLSGLFALWGTKHLMKEVGTVQH